MNATKYVAHRGYSMMAPENTMAAFELAGQSGFWGMECDTYCTVDGHWIVHHDRTVDRLTDGTGYTKDFAFEQIRRLNIDWGPNLERYDGLRIPTLEEAIDASKRYRLHHFIEIQQYHADTDLETLVGIVRNSGWMEHCSFICFRTEVLNKVRRLHDEVSLGFLGKKPKEQDIVLAKELGNAFLNYWYCETSFNDIQRAREAGVRASVWTVNTKEEAALFVKAGADCITTDTKLHD